MFRFNRRHSANRGLLFHRLCHALVTTSPCRAAQLAQRRPDLEDADQAHARRVAVFKKDQHQRQDRDRYRRLQEEVGNTVRPYKRKRQPEPAYDPTEEPF